MDVEKNIEPKTKGKAKLNSNNTFFLRNSRFFFLKKKGSKGQMFVIAGIIILIGFFLLRGVFSIYSTIEEKRFQETMILDKQLKNIYHEYEKTLAVSRIQTNPNNTAITNLYDFSNYLRNEEDIEILYVFVYVNNTAYSVTVGNFLNDRINVTVNGTTSTPASAAIGVMDDKTNATRNFAADITSGTVNITVTYQLRNENITERFPVRIGLTTQERSMMQGFFDIKLKSKDDFIRIKNTYNLTW